MTTAPEPPPVSRETAVARTFGPRAGLAVEYERILGSTGIEWGLVGPRERDRLWERHLLNCAVVAPALPPGATVADIGSGAGLPGLVWAIARPDLTVTLVEPLLRRATFLSDTVDRLGLDNCVVRRARAEDQGLTREVCADVVTARAVAPLGRLAGWCLPLARPGGLVLALKGAKAEEELAAARAELTRLGATDPRVEIYGVGIVEPPTRLVRFGRGPERRR